MYKTDTFPELYFAVMQAKIDHQNGIATQEKQG
jgi:hypothetical protein